MIHVDGSDGGGQLVRSAVGLSALLSEPVTVENIRGARSTPGLKHQHLAAVECLASVTDAAIEGASLGNEHLVFEPGAVQPGSYGVDVGTAGATTLVADAALPLALVLDEPISLSVRGGTDVKWSPPAAYVQAVKLRLLSRFGIVGTARVGRRGYYPAGGGSLTVTLGPSSPRSLTLTSRGGYESVAVVAHAATALEDAEVAERLVDSVRDELVRPLDRWQVEYDRSPETGAGIVLVEEYEQTVIGASALGEPGTPAEDVAATAVSRLRGARSGAAAVDKHLADQLVPILALCGGQLRIPELTEHVEASLALLDAFDLPVDVRAADAGLPDERILSAPRRLDQLP